MSIEMEIPKVLWLKNNMPAELFKRCKFYDLTDALEHLATGNEKRSFCSVVCKQGYVPVGVDGSVKGWQEDFLTEIGLSELAEDNFVRMGGVNGVVSHVSFFDCGGFPSHHCYSASPFPIKINELTLVAEWRIPFSWRTGWPTMFPRRLRARSSRRHCSWLRCHRCICRLDRHRRRKGRPLLR
jgi:hypothetical protein